MTLKKIVGERGKKNESGNMEVTTGRISERERERLKDSEIKRGKRGRGAGTSLLRARCFAAKKLEMNQSHVKRFIRFP